MREIIAYIKQTARMFPGDFISKTIAEIQTCRMYAFSPSFVGIGDPPSGGGCDRHDIETKSVDQFGHIFADISPRRDDQQFRKGSGRNQNPGFAFQNRYAGVRVCFSEDNRHQRRSIDHDHSGSPSVPYRKS